MADRRNNRKQKRPTAPFLGQSAPPVMAIASLRPAHAGPVRSPGEHPTLKRALVGPQPPPPPLDPRHLAASLCRPGTGRARFRLGSFLSHPACPHSAPAANSKANRLSLA